VEKVAANWYSPEVLAFTEGIHTDGAFCCRVLVVFFGEDNRLKLSHESFDVLLLLLGNLAL
jgi:hypothetical protein